jgi:hypothetical protein
MDISPTNKIIYDSSVIMNEIANSYNRHIATLALLRFNNQITNDSIITFVSNFSDDSMDIIEFYTNNGRRLSYPANGIISSFIEDNIQDAIDDLVDDIPVNNPIHRDLDDIQRGLFEYIDSVSYGCNRTFNNRSF